MSQLDKVKEISRLTRCEANEAGAAVALAAIRKLIDEPEASSDDSSAPRRGRGKDRAEKGGYDRSEG